MEIEKDGHVVRRAHDEVRPSTPRHVPRPPNPLYVDSASDSRTANNAVRHAYRTLSDAEKAQMVAFKDKGAEFLSLLEPLPATREIEFARQRIEEAVMWAVKHVTR